VSNKVTDFGGPKVGGAVASEFASCMSGEVELTLDTLDDCAGGQRATLAGEFLDVFDGSGGGRPSESKRVSGVTITGAGRVG
jgi:hypothetical protein